MAERALPLMALTESFVGLGWAGRWELKRPVGGSKGENSEFRTQLERQLGVKPRDPELQVTDAKELTHVDGAALGYIVPVDVHQQEDAKSSPDRETTRLWIATSSR
jgi:hypothetical protein